MRQQHQPQTLLPHERARPGCIFGVLSVVGIIWIIYTLTVDKTSPVAALQWLIVSIMFLVLIILCIIWSIYTVKRRREAMMAYAAWQQYQAQAYEAYQRQQQQRYYACQMEQRRIEEEHRRRLEEQERRERLAMVKTLGDLLVLSAKQFEHRVADLFAAEGYSNVQITGGSGDLMADIICTSPEGGKVVVQCKRYAPDHSVGSPEIQKFVGMIHAHHRADVGVFITTSSFTEPAKKLAADLNIVLIDGQKLCKYFLSAGQIVRN